MGRSKAMTPPGAPGGSWLMRIFAGASIAAGLIILVAVAWYGYARVRSGSDADRFNANVPANDLGAWVGDVAPTPAGGTPEPADGRDDEALRFASLYPGDRTNPKYWGAPLWAGSTPFGGSGLPDGFEPVSSLDVSLAEYWDAPARRIRIPAIGLDSSTRELALLDIGDQQQYETPNNTVGHIPDTAQPGQASNGWYFGHLESFVQGEGSVFRRLPEIADLALTDPVDIFIHTADVEYMYRVTGTKLVHQDDLTLTTTPDAQITLCTCWPRGAYDHRVLVHAQLMAIKR
ncbi:MAG: sortase [Dehalococcoidia bacterium]